MNDRDYPADRIERYVTALNDADMYAQLERRDDRVRFARAVMTVADAETDPVYKSGYDTGVMHARTGRIAAERDCLAMAVHFAIQWRPDAPMGLREGIEEILATMPAAGEKSSREATATPTDTNRRARLLHEITLDDRHWTSGDVVRWYRVNGFRNLGLRAARFDLAVLRDSGALTQHEEKSGRSFAHNSPKGGA